MGWHYPLWNDYQQHKMSGNMQSEKKEVLQLLNELTFLINNLPENGFESASIEQDLIKETMRKLYLKFLVIPQATATSESTNEQEPKKEISLPKNALKIPIAEQISMAAQIQSVMAGSQLQQSEIPVEIISSISNAETEMISKTDDVSATTHHSTHSIEANPVHPITVDTPPLTEVVKQESKAIEHKTIEERIQQLRAAALYEEPATLANKYAATDTIGDKITRSRTEKSLSEKLQQQPLGDLKQSIGINERFSFINELFEGNQQFYHQCIDQLNSLQAYEEAEKIMTERLALKKDTPRYLQFEELIRRRFNA